MTFLEDQKFWAFARGCERPRKTATQHWRNQKLLKLSIALTLTCIMAFAMNAQDKTGSLMPQVPGIELTGPPNNPVLTNHTAKTIVGYVLVFKNNAGNVTVDISRVLKPVKIAPEQDDSSLQRGATQNGVGSVSVDSVLYDDNTRGGPDTMKIDQLLRLAKERKH